MLKDYLIDQGIQNKPELISILVSTSGFSQNTSIFEFLLEQVFEVYRNNLYCPS